MSIFAYYFQIIFLTNYVSGKIEGHAPPQSTAAKNGGEGHVPPRLPGAPMIKPPRFQRLTSPMTLATTRSTHVQVISSDELRGDARFALCPSTQQRHSCSEARRAAVPVEPLSPSPMPAAVEKGRGDRSGN